MAGGRREARPGRLEFDTCCGSNRVVAVQEGQERLFALGFVGDNPVDKTVDESPVILLKSQFAWIRILEVDFSEDVLLDEAKYLREEVVTAGE